MNRGVNYNVQPERGFMNFASEVVRILPGAICAAALWISLGSAHAHEAVPRPTAGETKVCKALDEKTQFDFVERPLAEVAEAIGERHQIEVQLDRAPLEDEGIVLEEPIITCQIKHITLRTGLRLLLSGLDMTYIVRDGYLLLTTDSRAEELLVNRFYPIGDLIGANNGLRPEASASVRNKTARDDTKLLIDLVTFAVAATTWDEGGGPAAIADARMSKALIIWQTEEAHEDVAALLGNLRLIRDRQIKAARAIVGPPRPKLESELRLSIFRILKERLPAKAVVRRFDGSAGVTQPAAGTDDETKVDSGAPAFERLLEVARKPVSAETIAAALPELIEPETWQPKGPGVARAIGDAIVVCHTDDVRQRIAALLEELAPRQVEHRPPAARPPPLAVPGPRADWPQAAEPPQRIRGLETIGAEEIDEAIERKLAAPAEIDVSEMPLGQVLEQLGQRYDVPIQVDHKALADESVGLDTPITRRIRGVPLSSLLHLILDELDLTFLVFHGEALLVTAKVQCEALLFVKVYPVFDLVCRAAGENDHGAGLDYESLIDGLTTCVAPTTWDDVGGPGEIKVFASSGALVIGQTLAIHDDIAQYLKALRDVAVP